jgi:glycosyltransferase involved in cell wall biosynthesis
VSAERGLSLVVPAWNEEDRIGATLERYLGALDRMETPIEVIVVIDGLADGTERVVDRFVGRGVRKLVFPRKLGKGGAVLAGMRASRYAWVGYADADGAISPQELVRVVGFLDRYDCVVASRWLKESRIVRPEPLFNVVAGRAYNFLARSLLYLQVRDTQCGAKFLRREALDRILAAVTMTNRAFEISLLYHVRKSGGTIGEIPVEWAHDERSRMPIGKAIPIMFLSLVGLRVMNSPLRKMVPQEFVRNLATRWGTT